MTLPTTTYIIYTDGACHGNGANPALRQAEGAIGIYSEDLDVMERLPEQMRPHTADKSEFWAIYRALQEAPPIRPLLIRTDSTQCINTLTIWYYEWVAHGGLKTNGRKDKNYNLIRDIMDEILLRRSRGQMVSFKHVLGHSGN
ncbi:ribonuclease H-like protein, partial [Jaminaea rosea]